MTGRLLKRPEVEATCAISRSEIYRQMADGRFPRPKRTGKRAVRWEEEKIEAWKASRPTADTHV